MSPAAPRPLPRRWTASERRLALADLGHDTAWDPTGTSKAVALTLTAAGWVLVTTVAAAAARSLNRS